VGQRHLAAVLTAITTPQGIIAVNDGTNALELFRS